MARIFLGDTRLDAVPGDDRGLAYGDGLFETMRTWAGDVPWWPAHWGRLASGAARLGIPLPDEALVRREATALIAGGSPALKFLLTRGPGRRGYAPSDGPPLWMLSTHAVPPVGGTVALRWVETRLAVQPVLAGLKHCNRLEQVLARREWTPDEVADEGLMRDARGDVTCAVAANLFVLRDGRWLTPPLDRCGVQGVCREFLLGPARATEVRLSPADVESADAVFLCNALRGILEASRLGERRWAPHPRVAELRLHLAGQHPAFQPEPP